MSNSRIMKEFWGIASGYIKSFCFGFLVGVLTCIYLHDDGNQQAETAASQTEKPTPGYIPPEDFFKENNK